MSHLLGLDGAVALTTAHAEYLVSVNELTVEPCPCAVTGTFTTISQNLPFSLFIVDENVYTSFVPSSESHTTTSLRVYVVFPRLSIGFFQLK
jgi:hypothetical protein